MQSLLQSLQIFALEFISHQSFTFPVDCKVGDWKPWGKCSVTCGGGTKKRGREVIREAKDAGASCPDLEEMEVCNTEECPGTLSFLLFHFHHHISLLNCGSSVDCKVGDWSAWGDCNVTCGRGTKTKTREVVQQPKHRGETCPDLEITMVCNTEECPGPIFILLFYFHRYIILNVDLQLTAKLTSGLHGAIAMWPAAVEPRPKLGRSLKMQRTEELRVQILRKRMCATQKNAQVLSLLFAFLFPSSLYLY